MASLKATVVRATASDNNRKKGELSYRFTSLGPPPLPAEYDTEHTAVQASPQKPKGASAMQPNAKR